jgi:hypothetical protein
MYKRFHSIVAEAISPVKHHYSFLQKMLISIHYVKNRRGISATSPSALLSRKPIHEAAGGRSRILHEYMCLIHTLARLRKFIFKTW